MKILITGAAGFIGYHTSKYLLNNGFHVFGIDNLDPYYDINLKYSRLKNISNSFFKESSSWEFIKCNIEDQISLNKIFEKINPDIVINLAAQAGVRYSLENPNKYIQSNIVGFGNILECSRKYKIKHLIYASSSSVYGGNKKLPFEESDGVNHPVSLYAASKRSNELMAHTYSHLYKLPTTGLRFFTVYGPWGRPDMAYFIFTSKIIKGEKIKIFNNGRMFRDFTYIDDVIDVIHKLLYKEPQSNEKFNFFDPNPTESWSPFRVFNLGNSSPTNLIEFIEVLENHLGKKAEKEFEEMQSGDVEATAANINLINKWVGFKPQTSIQDGLKKFVDWYKDYYKLSNS